MAKLHPFPNPKENKMKLLKLLLVISLSWFSSTLFAADWVVDNSQSQLNFISTKKVNIAEVHQFNMLQGSLDSQGKFTLSIDLTSVNTNNPVRDKRMKSFLFNVKKFATATLTANIDTDKLDAIAEGASARWTVNANLDLHGKIKPLVLDVIVTRLVGAKLSVVSVQPIILNVSDFSLAQGVEKLRELAKLPSISHAVPVSFYITLGLKH